MKSSYASFFILVFLSSIMNTAFSAVKLECKITYDGLRLLDEKLKYTGLVILNITEFDNYNYYEINNSPVFMKIDNNKDLHQRNKSITLDDRSDTGKWDFSLKINYENGSVKTKDFMLDRNTGKLLWTEHIYTNYPLKAPIRDKIVGQCKKVNINKKLF